MNERPTFQKLYRRLLEIASPARRKREQYSDLSIVATYLWSVLHDRPQGWATRLDNWTREVPFGNLPSESVLSRRLKTRSVRRLLDQLLTHVWGAPRSRIAKCVDGRALTVSASSKDKTARFGAACGGYTAKGFRLHVIIDTLGILCAWAVTPLNHGEPTVARRLISRLTEGGYLLADNNYDRNGLYDFAAGYGLQLVAPRRKNSQALGKIRHSPHRLRAVELLQGPFGSQLPRIRHSSMERFFGNMGWRAGGLSQLPGFVRTMPRVRRWVQGKLILQGLHAVK